ncbi:putative esterase [Lachnellula hyalina]|uniref:Putative esterase n=1 Tax=Lachnellula hyalina TaxID=1316788 RepID=A0A8H8R8E5_9HELO|nr:putative esterase [Lachnellula hyalina]TVY30499.1 putative esterase [Lachnellula hyalina]
MASTTELDHVKAVWQHMRSNSPIYNFLLSELEVVSATKGSVTSHLTLGPKQMNSSGTIHGAVSAAIVDMSGGLAICSHGLEKSGASIDIHVTYIGQAHVGETIAIESTANKVGRMETCKICAQELKIELEPDDFDEATSSTVGAGQTAPDDLLLTCGCHFHWQCLLDESPQIAISMLCPSCSSIISGATSEQPQVITRYHNEGGVQENLDILPLITEEAYLDANPTARPARAFLTMCAEGDVAGVVELLKAIEEDRDEDDMSPAELLRYQDPLDEMKTGLHMAIEKNQQEAAWLLLWLASSLPTAAFPDEVTQAAQVMNAGRETADAADIRSLRDVQHRTAEDWAQNMGGVWAGLVGAGVLRG